MAPGLSIQAPQDVPQIRAAAAGDGGDIAAIYNRCLCQPPCRPDALPEAVAAAQLDEQLRALERLAGPVPPNYFGPLSTTLARAWVEFHATVRRPIWIAVQGQQVVGWLSLFGFSDRPAAYGVHELTYYVSPEHQRRGVAKRLLDHAMTQAPRFGAEKLLATVWHDNTPSLGLLQRSGFAHWGCIPKAVRAWGLARDLLILGHELPPPRSGAA